MSQAILHETSSGHVLSSVSWLDSHYEACRAEYESLLNFVPLAPGSSVLDAGCGSGSFVPSLRERVGPEGRVYGLDFAFENVCAVGEGLAGEVDGVATGSVLALPFADACMDAAWCANTAQYFVGSELDQLLSELKRAVRPGGLVAVKDVDMTAFRILPAPPLLGLHLAEAAVSGPDVAPQSHGSIRGRELRRLLEGAGLRDVRQASVVIERWAPLSEADARFWSEWLPYLAAVADARGVPAEDAGVWAQVRSPDLSREFVTRGDFYGCEMQVVAYGIVEAGDAR